jgi:hypothetical protein
MVAPEPDEPLLLYIAATSEAVSMVLVAERSDPHDLHELGSSSADGSGSQDPGPADEPGADAVGRSQSPEAAMDPPDQGVTGSLGSVLPLGANGREFPGPAPLERDEPDPPPPWEGLDRPTSGVLHQRGPPRSQDKVPAGPQAALYSPHRLQEATPLLSGL